MLGGGSFRRAEKTARVESVLLAAARFRPLGLGAPWAPRDLAGMHPPGTPQIEGGTGQNATKTSPNGPKMRFGAILDHLEATFIHCGPFEKVEKISIFDVILVDFGPFLG